MLLRVHADIRPMLRAYNNFPWNPAPVSIFTLYFENSCEYLEGDFVNMNELAHVMDSSCKSSPAFKDQS